MKYKRLTVEELKALEQDFIHFLASAQITGQDWEKMKLKEIEKAEELIDVFSDVVYDKILRKIKYLEFRDAKTVNIFYCAEDKIYLAGIRMSEHSDFDLTSNDLATKWMEENSATVKVVKTERKYVKERELEVFELLQAGCLITDDRIFKLLKG